jgi:hypothetical protein
LYVSLEDSERVRDIDAAAESGVVACAIQAGREWKGQHFALLGLDVLAALAFLFLSERLQCPSTLGGSAGVEEADEVKGNLATELEDMDECVAAGAERREVGEFLAADPLVGHVV